MPSCPAGDGQEADAFGVVLVTATEQPTATKQCPYCMETIIRTAAKCKHCGEFADAQPMKQCPCCRETVIRTAAKCKHCGEFFDDNKRPKSIGFAGVVLAIFVAQWLFAISAAILYRVIFEEAAHLR